MDPQPYSELQQQQQLAESLAVYTSCNFHPPSTPIRLSEHVKTFLRDVLGDDVPSVLAKPALRPPEVRNDLALADYFVSSSHNTYLLANQILGRSSAYSYTHVLSRGARCVEIDVWPSSDGPVVTHGYTLSQSIPFAAVCAAIGSFIQSDPNPDTWPVLVSLECHVYGENEQEELVRIMRDAWGERLVDGRLESQGEAEVLTPEKVMGRILVMVEYYPPLVVPTAEGGSVPTRDNPSSESSSSSSESEAQDSSYWPHKRSSVPQYLRIGPTLAAVGYYLRSMKPSKNWFTHLYPDPPHILLNISESSLLSLLKSKTPQLPPADNILMTLITHAQSHIRRIYPKGLRLTSSNLHPHPFWGSGSHVVALNWQTYDLGIQLNEAMFAGTNGWAAKPAWMRGNDSEANAGEGEGMRVKVKGEIVGVCSTPPPSDRERTPNSKPYNAYIKAQFLLPTPSAAPGAQALEYTSEAQTVHPMAGDLNFPYPATTLSGNDVDSLAQEWHELKLSGNKKRDEKDLHSAIFEWEFWERWEELTFLRLSICEKEFGKDDTLAIFCARVADIRRALQVGDTRGGVSGWRAVRMLDVSGKDCGTVAVVRFTFTYEN